MNIFVKFVILQLWFLCYLLDYIYYFFILVEVIYFSMGFFQMLLKLIQIIFYLILFVISFVKCFRYMMRFLILLLLVIMVQLVLFKFLLIWDLCSFYNVKVVFFNIFVISQLSYSRNLMSWNNVRFFGVWRILELLLSILIFYFLLRNFLVVFVLLQFLQMWDVIVNYNFF